MRSMAAPKSPLPVAAGAPNLALPARASCQARAARITAFEGTQPYVEAVAAQQMALDQRHPRAQPGGAGGADQSGGAGADHHQVISLGRSRVDPRGWVHAVDQLPVVAVERLEESRELRVQGVVRGRLSHR